MRKNSVPFISKGGVFKVSSLANRLKERVLLLNPFRDCFSLQKLSTQTEEKFTVSLIKTVDEIERSWLMSSSVVYFRVTLADK